MKMGITDIDFDNSVWVIEPGKYLVIDPCYMLGELKRHDWVRDFCDKIFTNEQANDRGSFKLGGHQILWAGTAHGDGGYEVEDSVNGITIGGDEEEFNTEVGVDAGMICIMPIELVEQLQNQFKEGKKEHLRMRKAGVEINVRQSVVALVNGGNWHIDGKMFIQTT